jgi:hypothetical protein
VGLIGGTKKVLRSEDSLIHGLGDNQELVEKGFAKAQPKPEGK